MQNFRFLLALCDELFLLEKFQFFKGYWAYNTFILLFYNCLMELQTSIINRPTLLILPINPPIDPPSPLTNLTSYFPLPHTIPPPTSYLPQPYLKTEGEREMWLPCWAEVEAYRYNLLHLNLPSCSKSHCPTPPPTHSPCKNKTIIHV